MIRNLIITVGLIFVAALLLSACSGQSAALVPTIVPARPTVTQVTMPAAPAAPGQPATAQSGQSTSTPSKSAVPLGDLTRTNEGGSVTFAIKPLNLGSGAATLDFDVSMNTHSVELGAFDLGKLAVLKTDTGVEIQPSTYKGSSGHHVEGKLYFPADKLAGAKTLTLTLKNVAGVAERTFTWNLM